MINHIRRFLIISILIVLFIGMILHYSATAPEHATVRQSYDKLQQPGNHVGDTVYFWAGVDEVSSDQITLRGSPTIIVVNVTTAVQPGDGVQVYGTIQSEHVVSAKRVIVTKRENQRQMFIISALSFLLAIGVFLRSWTVDIRTVTVIPRERDEDA